MGEKVIKSTYLPLGAESGENPLRMKSVKQRIKRFVHVKSNCFSSEGYKKRALEEIYFSSWKKVIQKEQKIF